MIHSLAQVQATAEPAGRCGRLIELYLLRALACRKQQQAETAAEAINWLERALELAEPEGYILLFLEEEAALMPLLSAVIKRRATPARLKKYAQKLLHAFPGYGPDETTGLVEPLTPREMEVLLLIAAGDANRTIAEKLVITTRTVKKHTGNIYGKLNVSSRTQAVARARRFGLLPPEA